MATKEAPNSSTRYSVIVRTWPPVRVFRRAVSHSPAAASRRYSGRAPMAKAPAITPGMDPMPPSTTAARMMTEKKNGKFSGLMNPALLA